MRILAFTDVHSNRRYEEEIIRKSKSVDFMICSGDIANFGRIDWDFIEKLDKVGKKIYFVDGAHEEIKDVKRMDKEFENWVWAHNKIVKHGEFYISGFGDLEFKNFDPDLHKLIKRLENIENLIFLSHVPPYNTSLDLLWDRNVGNPQLTQIIYKVRPILYVCGHLHENFHVKERIGRTLLVNPGPDGMVLEL